MAKKRKRQIRLIQQRTLSYWLKAWFDNKIVTVKDILNDNSTIVILTKDFTEKYGNVKSNFLQFHRIISAIPKRLFISGKNINIDNGIYDNGKPVAQG